MSTHGTAPSTETPAATIETEGMYQDAARAYAALRRSTVKGALLVRSEHADAPHWLAFTLADYPDQVYEAFYDDDRLTIERLTVMPSTVQVVAIIDAATEARRASMATPAEPTPTREAIRKWLLTSSAIYLANRDDAASPVAASDWHLLHRVTVRIIAALDGDAAILTSPPVLI